MDRPASADATRGLSVFGRLLEAGCLLLAIFLVAVAVASLIVAAVVSAGPAPHRFYDSRRVSATGEVHVWIISGWRDGLNFARTVDRDKVDPLSGSFQRRHLLGGALFTERFTARPRSDRGRSDSLPAREQDSVTVSFGLIFVAAAVAAVALCALRATRRAALSIVRAIRRLVVRGVERRGFDVVTPP